jgi:hypothetical protein
LPASTQPVVTVAAACDTGSYVARTETISLGFALGNMVVELLSGLFAGQRAADALAARVVVVAISGPAAG